MSAILREVLDRAFADGQPIRFIQIGGNDGIHMDPLYDYHVNRTYNFEWGHIYEPIPEYFDLLIENMRPFPYVQCHKVVVDDAAVPGRREFNYVSHADIERHQLPGSSKGIGSFSRDRNALGGIGYNEVKFNMIKDFIRTTEVQTVPARDVVREYGNANFLITDCEGYDVEIVSAAFDDTDFRPKVVQFEDLRHSPELLQSTLEALRSQGYRVIHSGKDVICELV